jgi:hypothetical protein
VGEEFIADSIQFGRLVDGRRAYYRVIGAPEEDGASKRGSSPDMSSEIGDTAAAVKKRKKEMLTPSPRLYRSISPINNDVEARSDLTKARAEEGNLSGEYADALSEAMKDVIAVQHLVSTAAMLS